MDNELTNTTSLNALPPVSMPYHQSATSTVNGANWRWKPLQLTITRTHSKYPNKYEQINTPQWANEREIDSSLRRWKHILSVTDRQEVKRLGTSENRNQTPFTSGYKEKEAFFLWTRITEGRKLYGEGNYTRYYTRPKTQRRGRPKTNWHDNITEWTGLKGHCLMRSGEDKRQWQKIVHEAVNPRIEDDWATTTTTT